MSKKIIIVIFLIGVIGFSAESSTEKFIRYQNDAQINNQANKNSAITKYDTNTSASKVVKQSVKPSYKVPVDKWTLGYGGGLVGFKGSYFNMRSSYISSIYVERYRKENGTSFVGYHGGVEFSPGEIALDNTYVILGSIYGAVYSKLSVLGFNVGATYYFSSSDVTPEGPFIGGEFVYLMLNNSASKLSFGGYSYGLSGGYIVPLFDNFNLEVAFRVRMTSMYTATVSTETGSLSGQAGVDTGPYFQINYIF